jgi:perosamine synthetase
MEWKICCCRSNIGGYRVKKILYSKPSIGELEKKIVCDAIENGWGQSCYDYIYKFQDSYKEYLHVKHAIATSSCTGAIHIALKALGIKSEDEVIVPDATWVASVAPIIYLSATPVFVDVLESTWCIDPKEIEKAITPKTKAIIAVHLYGNVCEMDEIMAIAKKNNLYVIEDSAEAIGSEYKGKKTGSMGDFGVFSFHGTKTITTGEGGMLVTNSDELFEKASILHDHGRDPKIKKMFWAEKIGFKYKMSNLQAALGYAQMQRAEELINKKIEIFNMYKNELSKIKGITMNDEQDYVKNSYWMPTIILDEALNINRDEFINYLNSFGIGARPFFYPVSSFPEFDTIKNNQISIRLGKNGINLPSNFEMVQEDVVYVALYLREFIKNAR